MKNKSVYAAIIASVYLAVYLIFLNIESFEGAAFTLLFFSPVILVWLAVTVLKDGPYKGKELGKDEWGYQDIPDKEML